MFGFLCQSYIDATSSSAVMVAARPYAMQTSLALYVITRNSQDIIRNLNRQIKTLSTGNSEIRRSKLKPSSSHPGSLKEVTDSDKALLPLLRGSLFRIGEFIETIM